MSVLQARVHGLPISQGSKRLVGPWRMIESNHATLRPWRALVTEAAVAGNPDRVRLVGPVAVTLVFTFPRPQSHHLRGQVRDSAPMYHCIRPDIDKVARAVLDSLTDAGWWKDDCEVSMLEVRKMYGDNPGVHAQAWEWR